MIKEIEDVKNGNVISHEQMEEEIVATEIVWTRKLSRSFMKSMTTSLLIMKKRLNTIQGIYRKAETLIDNPNIGYRHGIDELPDHIRIILYGHYRIAYLQS